MESLVVSTPTMANNTAMRNFVLTFFSVCTGVSEMQIPDSGVARQRENASVHLTQAVKYPQRSALLVLSVYVLFS